MVAQSDKREGVSLSPPSGFLPQSRSSPLPTSSLATVVFAVYPRPANLPLSLPLFSSSSPMVILFLFLLLFHGFPFVI